MLRANLGGHPAPLTLLGAVKAETSLYTSETSQKHLRTRRLRAAAEGRLCAALRGKLVDLQVWF